MSDDVDWGLLAKYFFGECSEEEEAKVRAWMEEDPKREVLLEELRQVRRLTRDPSSPESWDTRALWNRIDERTRPQESASGAPEPVGDLSERALDRPARRKHARRPSTRSPARRAVAQKAVVAGALALVIVAVFTLWLRGPWTTSAPEARTFATQEGQRATVRLTDGTRVQLNVDSRLTVSATFGEERRAVQLEGEAFFEVAKDSTRPFVVRTGGAITRVLGTSFDVSAYSEDGETRVIVSEGRVVLRPNKPLDVQEKGIVLTKRQMGQLLRSGEQVVRKNLDLDQHLGWMEGRLVFEDTPFREVARKLKRWYAITVTLEEGIPVPPGHLNARFAKDQPLSEVLNVVATAFGMEYERHRKRITFTSGEYSGSR